MQIINDKLISYTAAEMLSELEDSIKQAYNIDFKIKKGGILENILKILISIETKFQTNLEYLSKQFNPNTAEGFWQDALYERLGITRQKSEYAQLTKEIKGNPNSIIKKNAILIRSDSTGKEFTNTSEFKINSQGYAAVDFIATTPDKVTVSNNETFKIVRAPVSVSNFSDKPTKNIVCGRERESDENYRARFGISKAYNSKATARANISNLSRYLADSSCISIKDKNEDRAMNINTVLITAKHTTSDKIFAEAIFNTFGCGIKFLGSTTVTLKDIRGENVTVKFNNAVEVPIYINVLIKIKDYLFDEIVIDSVKENIINYLKNRKFGLGGTIYATELVIPILKNIPEVESVETIGIKSSLGVSYTNIIQLNDDEIPKFTIEQITVTKENN